MTIFGHGNGQIFIKVSMQNRIGKLIDIDWRELLALQPENIKDVRNLEPLKSSLRRHGFSLPFAVWKDGDKIYAVDGHTRKRALQELSDSGEIEVPAKLKAFEVKAENKKDAITILLEVYNQKHNTLIEEVLTEWLETEEIEIEDISSLHVSPAIYEFNDDNFDRFFSDDDSDGSVESKKITLVYPIGRFDEIMEKLSQEKRTKEEVFLHGLNNGSDD